MTPVTRVQQPGIEQEWRFEIQDQEGRPVRDFDEQHERLLHLIVVRRDLEHFQHLHPSLDQQGGWSQRLNLPEPGVYKAFADFSSGGRSDVLGVDLFAPGEMCEPGPADFRTVVEAEGYSVLLRTEGVVPRASAVVEFQVAAGGKPVSQLTPYLGALGHLVALREGDLAYLHMHALHEARSPGGTVSFAGTFPTRCRYRLFLDVKPRGHLLAVAFDLNLWPDV